VRRKIDKSFKDMSEAETKLYIAEVFHHMWYDEDFFKQLHSIKTIHEARTNNEPVFYPATQDEQLEQLKNNDNV
jgi:hypothetical protein